MPATAKPRRTVYLSNSGPWMPLGHRAVPPSVPRLFGRPRRLPGMVRLIKDVIRVGRWKTGYNRDGSPRFREFTAADLSLMESNFRRAQSRGVSFNLGKSHGDTLTGLIPTDELIAPVDEVVFDGRTLWASTYVSERGAAYLKNPARKVSPGIRWNWSDGFGNVYPIQLIHVAVTDHPVVAGQGPFVSMSNHQPPPSGKKGAEMPKSKTQRRIARRRAAERRAAEQRRRQAALNAANLANDDDDGGEGEGSEGGGETTIEGPGVNKLIELVDDVLEEAFGVHLPDGETGDMLVHDLEVILSAVTGEEPAEDEDDPEVFGEEPSIPAELSNRQRPRRQPVGRQPKADATPAWAKQLTDTVADLANTVADLQGERTVSAKQAFEARLIELGRAGMRPTEISRYKAAGQKYGYDIDILPAAPVAGVDMSNRSRSLADGSAPQVKGIATDLDDDEVEEAAEYGRTGRLPSKNSKKK